MRVVWCREGGVVYGGLCGVGREGGVKRVV